MGCHCIEIIRSFAGKGLRPVEVLATADTMVHPIDAEDSSLALIRFEGGALGQVEVNWTFRGGMDLRDEVAGTEGTIRLDHFLRTGFEMFTAVGQGGYVAEKADSDRGWLFPVGDEVHALGYVHMFRDMLDALDEGRAPRETFLDGYVVNAIIDACYASAAAKCWQPVKLDRWAAEAAGTSAAETKAGAAGGPILIKTEKMPDGQTKRIYKDPVTGILSQTIT